MAEPQIKPRRDRVRRRRADVRRRAAQLHARRGRHRRERADQPHQHAREHEGRRRLRPPHRVRRQHLHAALRHAARWQRHPDDGDGHRRDLQVHRHRRRRRRRQERAVLQGRRAHRRNLEHQPSGFIWAMDNWIYSTYNAVPPALDAEGRGAQGDDGAERRPVGPDPGRLRQGVVRRRRRRARPDQLPDADRVRRLQRRRSVRGRLPRRVAGLHRRPRRHAGRHGPRPHADRRAQPLHRDLRPGHLPRRPACPTTCAATCSSPSRSAASFGAPRSRSARA